MNLRTLTMLAALAANLVPAVAEAADEKWEITTRMDITGLPMRMPATTVIVCTPPGEMNEERMLEQDGCTLGRVTKTGNTTRFAIQCTEPQAMTGTGEITRRSADAWEGQFTASGKVAGKTVEMKAALSSVRRGDCDGGLNPASPGDTERPPVVIDPAAFQFEGFDVSDPAVLEKIRQFQQLQNGAQ